MKSPTLHSFMTFCPSVPHLPPTHNCHHLQLINRAYCLPVLFQCFALFQTDINCIVLYHIYNLLFGPTLGLIHSFSSLYRFPTYEYTIHICLFSSGQTYWEHFWFGVLFSAWLFILRSMSSGHKRSLRFLNSRNTAHRF